GFVVDQPAPIDDAPVGTRDDLLPPSPGTIQLDRLDDSARVSRRDPARCRTVAQGPGPGVACGSEKPTVRLAHDGGAQGVVTEGQESLVVDGERDPRAVVKGEALADRNAGVILFRLAAHGGRLMRRQIRAVL